MALRFVRFCVQSAAVADEKGQKGTNGKTGFDEWKRVCYTGGILKKEVCVMNHFHQIAAQLESNDLDAMLLTGYCWIKSYCINHVSSFFYNEKNSQ